MSERIFNVSRSTKTGKTVNVGDFPTVEQAQAAITATIIVCYSMCCWSSRGLSVSKYQGEGDPLPFLFLWLAIFQNGL